MKKILIVNANYYNDITIKLENSAVKLLKKYKFHVSKITISGALEIPIIIRKNINKFDGFIALGCVIKGKTSHYELICKSTFYAIMDLSILYNKPIGNGIITALNKTQAYERSSAFKSNKGFEAAMAVVSVFKNGPQKI